MVVDALRFGDQLSQNSFHCSGSRRGRGRSNPHHSVHGDPLMRLLFAAGTLALTLLPLGAEERPPKPVRDRDADVETLSAVPRELRAGSRLMVAGSGCDGGSKVRFDLYDPALSSSTAAVADAKGTFEQVIHVPSTARVGRARLQAVCQRPENREQVQEAAILITPPIWAITWTNVAFGLATSLIVAGVGLNLLRRPSNFRKGRRGSPRRRRIEKL